MMMQVILHSLALSYASSYSLPWTVQLARFIQKGWVRAKGLGKNGGREDRVYKKASPHLLPLLQLPLSRKNYITACAGWLPIIVGP